MKALGLHMRITWMTDWPYVHVESIGPGRRLLLKRKGPWLFEGKEQFPTLGGIRQRMQIGEFEEFGRGLVIDGATQLYEGVWTEIYSAAWHEQLFSLPPSFMNQLG